MIRSRMALRAFLSLLLACLAACVRESIEDRPRGAEDAGADELGDAGDPFDVGTDDPSTPPMPEWTRRVRMVDVVFRETFPSSAREVVTDGAAVRKLIDDAVRAGGNVLQFHFSREFFYADWIDDTGFAENLKALREATDYAHAKSVHVLMYMNGCEIMTPGANPDPSPKNGIDPRVPSVVTEHPDWLQRTSDGRPIWYSGVTETDADYIQSPDWQDAWVSPLGPYRAVFLDRVDQVIRAGADGIFVDVANLPGNAELLPSFLGVPDEAAHVAGCYNPECLAAFADAFPGTALPSAANHLAWDDDAFRRWVWFRHQLVADYYDDMERTVHAANPTAVVFAENSGSDVPNDVIDFGFDSAQTRVAVIPELSSVLDESDGCEASPRRYATYFARAKYHQGMNHAHGRPFVPLGYFLEPEDGAIQLGLLAAASGNYFAFGLADELAPMLAFLDSAGAALAHEATAARVVVFASPETRDFVDRNGGDVWDTTGTTHFAAYRRAMAALVDHHVPFDVLPVEASAVKALSAYDALILPDVQCMSGEAVAKFNGLAAGGKKLLVIGEAGSLDRWGRPEPKIIRASQIYGRSQEWESSIVADLGSAADVVRIEGAHGIDSPEPVLAELVHGEGGSTGLHLVNLTAAVPGTCPMLAAPLANVAISVACTALARCDAGGSSAVTLHAFSGDGSARHSQVDATVRDGRVELVLPSLSTYTILVL
jgi:hypothetical protein